jgi:hypothetical protein
MKIPHIALLIPLLLLTVVLAAPVTSSFSTWLFVGKNLKSGFDIGKLRLDSAVGGQFPKNNQLVIVRSLFTPFIERNGQEPASFKELESQLKRQNVKAQLILTPWGDENSQILLGNSFPKSWKELIKLKNTDVLQSPQWTAWLDLDGSISEAHAPKSPVNGEETRGTTQYIACVRDSKIIAAYQDFLISAPFSDRLPEIYKECLQGKIKPADAPLDFQSNAIAPEFILKSETGQILKKSQIKGPFAILTQSRVGFPELPIPSPKEYLQAAQKALDLTTPKMPVYVLALEGPADINFLRSRSATDVASIVRKQLDVPVFEDIQGDFINAYSHYLRNPNVIILFDVKGRAVDSVVMNSSKIEIPNSLSDVLLEFGFIK